MSTLYLFSAILFLWLESFMNSNYHKSLSVQQPYIPYHTIVPSGLWRGGLFWHASGWNELGLFWGRCGIQECWEATAYSKVNKRIKTNQFLTRLKLLKIRTIFCLKPLPVPFYRTPSTSASTVPHDIVDSLSGLPSLWIIHAHTGTTWITASRMLGALDHRLLVCLFCHHSCYCFFVYLSLTLTLTLT